MLERRLCLLLYQHPARPIFVSNILLGFVTAGFFIASVGCSRGVLCSVPPNWGLRLPATPLCDPSQEGACCSLAAAAGLVVTKWCVLARIQLEVWKGDM